MAASQITVLNDLPKFKGDQKPGDTNFQPGINVKTFFRTLDNHFKQQSIDNDQTKLQVLYALIDKEQGNAIDLVTCYAGKDAQYEDVKSEFMLMYPNFTASEFSYAARTALNNNINDPSIFCGMTKIQTQTQALVESYLSHPEMTKVGLLPECEIETVILYPGGGGESGPYTISIQQLLQNFSMHLFTATQLPNSTYDKLAGITPNVSSTRFMSLTVRAAQKQELDESYKCKKKPVIDKNQVIFQVQKREQQTYSKQRGDNKKACFRCGNTNHISKDCRVETYCSFCKIKGHTLKVCRKKKSQGKFCATCKKANSHDTKDCYSNQRLQVANVIEESTFEEPDGEYEDNSIPAREKQISEQE